MPLLSLDHPLKRARSAVASLALGLTVLTLGANRASAQVESVAEAAFAGYNSAFLLRSGGQTFYHKTISNTNPTGTWGEATDINLAQDAYDRAQTATNKQLVTDLMASFLAQNNFDWATDTWNDDIAWMAQTCIRGYQITGNTTYLNKATYAWNLAYNRGWDSTFGGGIWENMGTKASKCALSNDPFVTTGCSLYQITGDSTYLTKAKAIYAWVRSNLLNTTTGQVNECIKSTGLSVSDNIYNSGHFVHAANVLYNITGSSNYYNDALLAADHVVNEWPIVSTSRRWDSSEDDNFMRGLAYFCRDNNLWSRYYPWMFDNAAAAWSKRRTDYNITWNNFTAQTATDDTSNMECQASTCLQLVIPPRYEVESQTVATYTGPDFRILPDSNFSGGSGVILDSNAVGNTIAFLVENVGARKYDVRVGVKKLNTRGIFQLAIGQAGNHSPANVGGTHDLYSSSGQYTELDLGTWTPATAGDKWIWFTITGKNASSTGYSECFDYILLLPIK